MRPYVRVLAFKSDHSRTFEAYVTTVGPAPELPAAAEHLRGGVARRAHGAAAMPWSVAASAAAVMARKVFVGSLPPDITEEALRGASKAGLG